MTKALKDSKSKIDESKVEEGGKPVKDTDFKVELQSVMALNNFIGAVDHSAKLDIVDYGKAYAGLVRIVRASILK